MSYEYTTIDHWHPNPEYRPRDTVAVNVTVAGVELFATDTRLSDTGGDSVE